jgi:transcription initiation factor TFIIIB Brf1 subunit/transcription initiation factor TFIIB
VQTRKLSLHCPVCGSAEVFYSCTPNCCFNHVCADCGATFEPATRRKGGTAQGIVPPDPLPDATDPTAGCAACDSTAVYQTEDGSAVCEKCGTLLELEYTEVKADTR